MQEQDQEVTMDDVAAEIAWDLEMPRISPELDKLDARMERDGL